ncbi:MAG: thioredoxin family protein [Planctomycetota bacterium]|nr:thioredoxin family protein [Planctomycetota bacterium]
MKKVEVLGSGCAKCVSTAKIIQAVADECGVPVTVTKDPSLEALLRYGVMGTPAVVVDGRLMHSGSVPGRTVIEAWLKSTGLAAE